MNEVFKFLKSYSTDPFEIDRLIVSAYFKYNNIFPIYNDLLLTYCINEDGSSEDKFLEIFLDKLQDEAEAITLETIINLFEFVVSPADKIINGAVYTPKHIREYIVEKALENFQNVDEVLVCDLACGCGSFLLTTALKLHNLTNRSYQQIIEHNIYGLDIQEYSVTRTKLLLNMLALSEGEDPVELDFKIFSGDALTYNWVENIRNFVGFSAIVGNPPYVRYRNLDEQSRANIKLWSTARSGLTDLYIPFFQIGIEALQPNGVLSFITMNSFFKSLNGRDLRQYFQEKSLDFVIEDFGAEQVFKSKNTYVCICTLYNRPSEEVRYHEISEKELSAEKQHQRLSYISLNSKTGWNLKNNNKVSKIEGVGKRFGEVYKTRHGIATLKNDIYIFSPDSEDDGHFFLQNGKRFAIEKGICREIVNSNKLSRVKQLNNLKETIIFPYNYIGEKIEVMKEEQLQDMYPNAYQYLKYKKDILDLRDNGKAKTYANWYAYGRTQSLERMTHKLFFPKFSDVTPSYIADHDENLMFYNGLALIGKDMMDVEIARKIMESKIFWFYIKSTSKPYANNYYSLNGNYINNFGVCELSDEEKSFLLKEERHDVLDKFFEDKYSIRI